MSREYNESCCWTIEKFSFFHNYFAIIDTADYLADQLFIKHQVRVGFGPEFVCPDAPYRVIMCKCRKRDVDAFLAAIRELPNKMPLRGYAVGVVIDCTVFTNTEVLRRLDGVNIGAEEQEFPTILALLMLDHLLNTSASCLDALRHIGRLCRR